LVTAEPVRAFLPFEWFFERPFPLLSSSWWVGPKVPEMEEMSLTLDIFVDNGDIVVKAERSGMKKRASM
jgi:hypothetical protein